MGTADSSQADTTWRMRIAQFTAFAGVSFVGLYLLRIQGRSARSAAAFSGFMSLWLTFAALIANPLLMRWLRNKDNAGTG